MVLSDLRHGSNSLNLDSDQLMNNTEKSKYKQLNQSGQNVLRDLTYRQGIYMVTGLQNLTSSLQKFDFQNLFLLLFDSFRIDWPQLE